MGNVPSTPMNSPPSYVGNDPHDEDRNRKELGLQPYYGNRRGSTISPSSLLGWGGSNMLAGTKINLTHRQRSFYLQHPHQQVREYGGPICAGVATFRNSEICHVRGADQFASADDDPTAAVIDEVGQQAAKVTVPSSNPYLSSTASCSKLVVRQRLQLAHPSAGAALVAKEMNPSWFSDHHKDASDTCEAYCLREEAVLNRGLRPAMSTYPSTSSFEAHKLQTMPKSNEPSPEQLIRQVTMSDDSPLGMGKRKLPSTGSARSRNRASKRNKLDSKSLHLNHDEDIIRGGSKKGQSMEHDRLKLSKQPPKTCKSNTTKSAKSVQKSVMETLQSAGHDPNAGHNPHAVPVSEPVENAFKGENRNGGKSTSTKSRSTSTPAPDAPMHVLMQPLAERSKKAKNEIGDGKPSPENCISSPAHSNLLIPAAPLAGEQLSQWTSNENDLLNDTYNDDDHDCRHQQADTTGPNGLATGSNHRLLLPSDETKGARGSRDPDSPFKKHIPDLQQASARILAVAEYSNDSFVPDFAGDDDASTTSSMESSSNVGFRRRKDVLWTAEEDDALTAGLEALFSSEAWINKHGDDEDEGCSYNACISNEEWEFIVQNYLASKRNIRQCRRRWARMKKLAQAKPPPKQGERWTAEEDETLRLAVLQEKHISPRFKWSWIARKYFNDTRSSEQCRTRWNVRVKHPDWTAEDDALILSMKDAGKSWSEISKCFPSRPTVTVQRRWVKLDTERKLSADPLWGGWSPEEMKQLVSALSKAGDIHWKEVEGLPSHIRGTSKND